MHTNIKSTPLRTFFFTKSSDGGVIPPDEFNFDITADWAMVGVSDQSTFEALYSGSNPDFTVYDFEITGDRIQAVVTGLLNLEIYFASSIDLLPTEIETINFSESLTAPQLDLTNLTSLNTIFGGNLGADTLDFSNCPIEYINIQSLPNLITVNLDNCSLLKELFIAACPMTAIDVSDCTATYIIYFNDTLLTTVDLSNNVSLIQFSVYCDFIQGVMTSITGGPFNIINNFILHKNSFSQAEMDKLADWFLAGSNPLVAWDSSDQVGGIQPSMSKQILLTANVASVSF